jgi:hypothetical protein
MKKRLTIYEVDKTIQKITACLENKDEYEGQLRLQLQAARELKARLQKGAKRK